MHWWLSLVLHLAAAVLKSRRNLLFENAALRHQLLVLTNQRRAVARAACGQRGGSSGFLAGAVGGGSRQTESRIGSAGGLTSRLPHHLASGSAPVLLCYVESAKT